MKYQLSYEAWATLPFLGYARSWNTPFQVLGTGTLLGHAFKNYWVMPAFVACPLTFLGQARSGDILSSWDKTALGTCPLTFLGQARSGDRPFKILGTCPFLGHALLSSKFLGLDRSWYMPLNILGAASGRSTLSLCAMFKLIPKASTSLSMTAVATSITNY